MATGFVRGINPGGRIVLPRETLRSLHIEPGDLIKIYVYEDADGRPAIALRKADTVCAICRRKLTTEDTMTLHDVPVCNQCLVELAEKLYQPNEEGF
jgi:bifunctional DNA-binding transcriptional regulator/antitoxin component of YhaV-PrlF toxin-antitoxin module